MKRTRNLDPLGHLPFREKISINNEHGEALACACAAVFWVESLKNVECYAAQKGHQDPCCSHYEMPTGGPVMCQIQGTHDRNRTQCLLLLKSIPVQKGNRRGTEGIFHV